MTSGIYLVLNTLNFHCYVGSSIDIEGRVARHLKGEGSQVVKSAKKKYGMRNMSAAILKQCSEEDLIEREQFWIDEVEPEYNLSSIAGRAEMTPEVRKKMSESHKGNQNALGHRHSEEARKKISEKTRKAMRNPEVISKLSKCKKGKSPWNKGKKVSEEHRLVLSEAHKGICPSIETRKKKKK